jgi:hypothetical protein
MQDCVYVYEHRDPRTNRTVFVGRGQKREAWWSAELAVRGRPPKRHEGLHWYLREMIEAEMSIESLAPHIVGCYRTAALADAEVARRVTAYGADKLLNGRPDRFAFGAPTLPDSNCGHGAVCEFQFKRVSWLETFPRQVGVFGYFVPCTYLGMPYGGFWYHAPIIHSQAFIDEQRRDAALEEPEDWKGTADQFLLGFAVKKMWEALQEDAFNGQQAALIAGVIRQVLKRNFFIVEVDHEGDALSFHDQKVAPSQFGMADKVMRDIKRDLKKSSRLQQPAIWAKVDDGTYMEANGAFQNFDPNAPALPPPNHKKFVRKPLKFYKPSPVMTKPSGNDPKLMGALARLEHLIQGGTPPPTNGVPISPEEVLHQKEMKEIARVPHHNLMKK